MVSNRKDRTICNMSRYSSNIEMLVYRFIMSIAVGFCVGSYMIPNSRVQFINYLAKVVCRHPVYYNRMSTIHDVVTTTPPPIRQDNQNGILYIGMMSMEKNLQTRVKAASETWSQHQRVRFEIFAKNNGTRNTGGGKITDLKDGARIIQLPAVSDVSYPPQKKSFAMLKFIHDNYLENFDWFLRLDDDAYVKVDKLVQFLSRLDPSKPFFIGHPGFGRDADDYMTRGENYCMGGTGVIFSKALLRKIGPKLSTCLKEMYTEHEDVELGRCVRKITGVKCTQSWEIANLFYQNYNGDGGYQANIKELDERKRDFGLIFHANKEPEYQYKFHRRMLMDRITVMMTKIAHMQNEIKKMNMVFKKKEFDIQNWNVHAGYVWDAITRRSVYTAHTSAPLHGIPSSIKHSAVNNVYFTIQDLRKRYPRIQRKIKEISVMSMRYFVNPLTSVDMVTKLRATGMSSTRQKTSIYLNGIHFRKMFLEKVFFVEKNELNFMKLRKEAVSKVKITVSSDPTIRVNFIMALSGRPENLVRFLQNFKDCFWATGEKVSLTIVYFPEKEEVSIRDKPMAGEAVKQLDSIAFVKSNFELVRTEYPHADLSLVPVTNGISFSRGKGLQMGARKLYHNDSNDELIFFCDVDLIFQPEILLHIRRNTIRGKQVYYPVFFSQYDPNIIYSYQKRPQTHFYFEEIAGFWRTFSYGMVSIYKSDFEKTGGFDLSIKGWGLEDLRFADAVLKAKLRVFKSNEQAMVHIYHDKICSTDLNKEQFKSCQNSRAQHFGPQTLMYYLWHKGPYTENEDYESEVDIEMEAKDDTPIK